VEQSLVGETRVLDSRAPDGDTRERRARLPSEEADRRVTRYFWGSDVRELALVEHLLAVENDTNVVADANASTSTVVFAGSQRSSSSRNDTMSPSVARMPVFRAALALRFSSCRMHV
jgi:hypothetical protein